MTERSSALALACCLAATGCGGPRPTTVMFPDEPSAMPAGGPEGRPSPGAPRVHVALAPDSSPRNVMLYELRGLELRPVSVQGPAGGMQGATGTSIGRAVCAPPCGQIVDGRREQEFYFGGPGVSESRHFTLAGETGDLFFNVRPGVDAAEKGGITLTTLGATGVVVGAVILLAASTGRFGPSAYRDGGVVVGVNSAMLATGIALLLTGRTTFTVRRESAP